MDRREAWKKILLDSKRKGHLIPSRLVMTDEEYLAFLDGKIDGVEQRRSLSNKGSESIKRTD